MTEPTQKPLTPHELREATIWRVLRAAYIRVEARHLGKLPITLTEPQANGLIDRWTEAMSRDVAMLAEIMEHARAEGAGQANARYHASAVEKFAGDELLDQVLEPHTMPEEAPLFAHPRHAVAEALEEGETG